MTRPRALTLLFAGLALALLAAFAGCLPSYTFGGEPLADGGTDATSLPDGTTAPEASSGADGGTDATIDSPPPVDATGDGGSDALPDAPPRNDGSLAPVAIAEAGAKPFSTGFGYQLHLVFARNDGRYWFFFVDDSPGVIKTATSPDLLTWTPGASVPLASGFSLGDGEDFSVAYANLGGRDVVHIVANSVAGTRYEAFHIRATIAGGTIAASTPVALPDTDSAAGSPSGQTCPQAGPATVIAADGHVWDVTAWTGHASTTCDTNVYVSPGADTGTSWDPSPFAHDGYFVSVPSYAFGHDLVSLPEAGVVMAVWPDEDNTAQTLFDSFGWALSPTFDGGGPGTTGVLPDASAELFAGTGAASSYDDWTTCRLTDTSVHVLRHVLAPAGSTLSAFQEVVYDGAGWQSTAPAPPAVASLSNTGVVLVSDATPAHGILLATIGTDNAVNLAKWTPGGAWGALKSIPATAPRQSLGGTGCGNDHPAIFWTEGAGSPYAIQRVDVSSLLGP